MRVFIDTSAFYAVLDADDEGHPPAKETWLTPETAFTLDDHFAEQGFTVIPSAP